MKLATANEMRAADEASFKALGVPSRTVMEMAGRAIADFLLAELAIELQSGVVVYFGGGNNGGDGLIVARHLHNLGIPVTAVGVQENRLKEGASAARRAYLAAGGKVADTISKDLAECGVAIDAIYGTGFKGVVPAEIEPLILSFNSSSGVKVSIDLPSGMEADRSALSDTRSGEFNSIAAPDITLALQLPKFAHVFYPAAERCGEVYVLDIGLVDSLPEIAGLTREILDDGSVQSILREQHPFEPGAHKGSRGRVTIVGGGQGSLGAPKLSSVGAFRAGAGLITVASPDPDIGRFPDPVEVMTKHLDKGAKGLLSGQDALVLGPGLAPNCSSIVAELLDDLSAVNGAVLDAGALTILSAERGLWGKLSPKVVLTPHPGEMSRLLGISIAEIESDRIEAAEKLCRESKSVIVLKGASTVIATPHSGSFICPIAEPTLGVAGSGDVLAGVIGALIGQGYSPSSAATAGVYLHARAGQLVAERLPGGALATEIAAEVPAVRQALAVAVAPPQSYQPLRPTW